jgi:hypothetical protein
MAASKRPAPAPVEAPAASAPPQQAPETAAVIPPASPFDRIAELAPAETNGAGVVRAPEVQEVDAAELNHIDRKAEAALAADPAGRADAETPSEQASSSWLGWLWSAVGSTFAALATAVHQLIGL